ncbi:thioester-containing protein 1 allele R1-like [Musca vetustissima]|uniref:thioester-containing protein 1 allele R1-like n=1 Tax=Musca vetustissima TaxID=27455 RepID=UPI002AB71330|nr:thioester-containing protein 1 allele R1-like [Musca vetustissima]
MDNKNGYYTIVAPFTIQSGLDYAVTITTYQILEPVTIKITIAGPTYSDFKTIHVLPCTSEIVNFKIPAFLQEDQGQYKLLAEGIHGLTFKNDATLFVANYRPKLYIQTDKAMYKPGDLVQFRILALDENLRPAKLQQPLNFAIRDGAGNQITYLKDIEFTKGVHSGKFQLSEQPVLGHWHIDITTGVENKDTAHKQFEVAKYVLPKFTVEIETDEEVAILDKVLKITIISKYTYGKPVCGKATITVNLPNLSKKVQKTLDINGRGQVEFDLMEDLKLDHFYDHYMPQLNVEATMTEALTDFQQSTTANVNVRLSRFKITVPNILSEYEVGKPFEIKAIIKRLNGLPVTNAKSTAKLLLNRHRGAFHKSGLIFESSINQYGIAEFQLKFSKAIEFGSVRVMYEEEMYDCSEFIVVDEIGKMPTTTGLYSYSNKPLRICSTTKEFQIGEDFTLDVVSQKPLSYLVYTIKARGKIIQNKYIHIDEQNQHRYKLQLKATFDMIPKADVFIYSIDDGKFCCDETTINICNEFENKLEISAPEQAKASDVVNLAIKSDTDSFIGLLAVDQSVLLLQSGNDFDKDAIFNGLNCNERQLHGFNSPGWKSCFVTMTNASSPVVQPQYRCFAQPAGMLFGGPPVPGVFAAAPMALDSLPMASAAFGARNTFVQPPKIRKNFVETWIFDNIESTDSNGIASLSKKIPDTITSWIITGFSINDKTGFCLTDAATKIRVFQPFFLSTNLPYSIKRGEIITVPVTVFNYMDHDLETVVTMDNEDNDYEFVDDTSEGNELTKKVCVPSNGAETLSFTIKPKIVGDIMLKIKALTPLAGDAMHQKLKVEPEGVTKYENECHFISVPKGLTVEYNLKANIPKDVVIDSEYLEFMVVGDILGPTIKNIDKLVRMPYGCGEQNMINFVPNILVLEYLNAIGRDMPLLAQKAKNFMEAGFQRELTYKHKNGAYSAFGEGSSEPNSWLTAYVVRSFMQARKFITIDNRIIEDALEYLVKTQKDNGQFPQTGQLFHSSNQNELAVSAFILLAFLEDKDYAMKYKLQIDKAIQYLAEHAENEDNIYTLALLLLVFQKVQHSLTTNIKDTIQSKSQYGNNLKWWSNSLKYNNNNDIEVTAYILQSLLETEEPAKLLPIIKWLIGQRNNLGGFNSTQDTVVGLKALVAFAEKYKTAGNGQVTIKFQGFDAEDNETTSGNFQVDRDNCLTLQSHLLPKSTRKIHITGEGDDGSALIQLSYQYNVHNEECKPSFIIQHTMKSSAMPPNMLSMNVVAEYKPQSDDKDDPKQCSNMIVMEIALPSGYVCYNHNMESIRKLAQVQRVETKNDDTIIVIYFEKLHSGEPVLIDILADKSHDVGKLKPVPITIYDYYNADQRTTVYYDVNK